MSIFTSVKRQIPNIITLCNLTCGVLATNAAVQGALARAAFFICLGILFDFFDGLTARALHVASPLGKELDSLADIVTSGVAPAFILSRILSCGAFADPTCLLYVAILIPAFSAYRLAKFNLDTRQSHSFLGLPVPCNALIWAALGILAEKEMVWVSDEFLFGLTNISLIPTDWTTEIFYHPIGLYAIAALSILTDILMISEVPMFALKFKNLSWKDNKLRFLFLITCAALLILFGVFGIILCILLYIILSLLTQKKTANE